MPLPRFRVAVSFAVLFAFAACTPELVAFLAPTAVRAGSIFEITAVADHPLPDTGDAGCVLQLPDAFEVVGHRLDTNVITTTVAVNSPALLSNYTAEPGHHLWSIVDTVPPPYTPQNPVGRITLRVFVRAPVTASGPFVFKLAVVGGTSGAWTAVAPAGVTQFASITSAAHVHSLMVTPAAEPLTAFELDVRGCEWATGRRTSWMALDDLDGDGDDDALQALTTSAGLFVGIGAFLSRPGASWVTGGSATGYIDRFDAGDFDGDGHLDIVMRSGAIYFGDGGTTWTPGGLLPVFSVGAVAVGDVNGDGRADVVHCNGGGIASCHLGNANRTFTAAGTGFTVVLSGPVTGILLSDLDGDGDLDVHFNGSTTANVYLGDGTGAFAAGSGLPLRRTALAGDFDGDGVNDLLLLGTGSTLGVTVYRHVGGGAFAPLPVAGLPPTGANRSAVVIDFDGDGRADIVTGYLDVSYTAGVLGTSPLELYRNLGGAVFQLQTDSGLGGMSNVHAVFTGDFDGDGSPDLVTLLRQQAVFYSNTRSSPFVRLQNGCSNQSIRCTGDGSLGSVIEVRIDAAGTTPVIGLGVDPTPLPLCADCVVGHDWAYLQPGVDLGVAIPAVPALTGAIVGFQGADLFVAGGCTQYSAVLTDTVLLTIR